MARPQAVVSLPRQEGTVILAFDVSASMGATDLAPTRMEAAKAAAKDFVARQPSSITIGVVAFSDSGVSVQAPTNDQATVLSAIDRLAPQRGTSVAQGILASLKVIATAPSGAVRQRLLHQRIAPRRRPSPTPTPVPAGIHAPAVIVLLSDGENNEIPDPLAAAQAAADQGVRIYTVGIGSAAGSDAGPERLPGPHPARRGDAPEHLADHRRHLLRRHRRATAPLDLRQPRHPARDRAAADRDHRALRGPEPAAAARRRA